jgi:hypothetical protein
MKYRLVLLAYLILILTSCQRGLYIPDKVNSPGFKEAGEVKLDLSVKPQMRSTSGSPFSFSSDIAYAPVNHLGVLASYRNVNNKVSEESDIFSGITRSSTFNGHRFDMGVGYFSKIAGKGKFELYGGYGNGVVKTDIIYGPGNSTIKPDDSYSARYNRFFVQSAIGLDNTIFSLMCGSRFTSQKYYDFRSSNPDLQRSLIPDQSLDATKQAFGFIEPYIELQVGFKYVKFNYQCGSAFQVSGPSLKHNAGLPYMSFGILLHYAPRFRNSKG